MAEYMGDVTNEMILVMYPNPNQSDGEMIHRWGKSTKINLTEKGLCKCEIDWTDSGQFLW